MRITDNTDAYMTRGSGIIFGLCEYPKPKTATFIHEENPVADYVIPIWKVDNKARVDYVRLWDYFKASTEGVLFVLRHAISMICDGGFLIIIEPMNREKDAKQFYNFEEMEGYLMMLDDYVHIDAKGIGADGKEYFYICRINGREDSNAKKVSK